MIDDADSTDLPPDLLDIACALLACPAAIDLARNEHKGEFVIIYADPYDRLAEQAVAYWRALRREAGL